MRQPSSLIGTGPRRRFRFHAKGEVRRSSDGLPDGVGRTTFEPVARPAPPVVIRERVGPSRDTQLVAGPNEKIVRRVVEVLNTCESVDEAVATGVEELWDPEIEFVNPEDAVERGTRKGVARDAHGPGELPCGSRGWGNRRA
jgi:hypothetical protein